MGKPLKTDTAIRRTAREVMRYRIWMRLIPILVGVLVLVLILTYVISMLYNQYGAFTVTVNKFDNVRYALSLSETPAFESPTSRLNSRASQEVTNIDGSLLPLDLDRINGSHNGRNYVAYTFYCKNAGTETVNYEYQLYIANATLDIEKAVRIRFYVDGEMTTYARTKGDGTGAEPGTTEFLTETVITRAEITDFAPGDMTKFTVVIWVEGNDPDCVDSLIGGSFKIDMSMSIKGIGEDGADK